MFASFFNFDHTLPHKLQLNKSMKSSILKAFGYLIVVIAVLGGMVLIAKQQDQQIAYGDIPAPSAADWSKGNLDSKLVIVEYSDFQCPACAAVEPIVKDVITKYGDRVHFIYRHFPLYQIHAHASAASELAQAAGVQNKFWEMHDLLFAKQTEWDDAENYEELFTGYANSLGLNLDQLTTDRKSEAVIDKIGADVRGGMKASVSGTPTFFVNGKAISTPRSLSAWSEIIDAKLAEMDQAEAETAANN